MSTKSFSISDIEQTILNSPLQLPGETPVIEAIRLMSQVRETCYLTLELVQSDTEILNHSEQASCILVVKNEKLIGIFTERDIVRCTAMGLNLEQATLAEVMVANPITIKKSQLTNIFVILNLFRQYKIRHITVVDDQNHIVGLITNTTLRQLLQAADLLKIRTIGEVMTSEVIQAPPTTSVLELARLMAEYSVSCVVITKSDSQPIGIVTERDIVQMRALELDILEIQADVVMSTPLFCMRPQQSLWEAHQQMQQRHTRRLVVVRDGNELLGIVTQTSILYSLDPLEMYETVNFLQQKVYQLEAEKVDILQKQNTELEIQVQERTLKLIEQANADKLLATFSHKIRNSLDLESILQSAVSEIRGYLQTDRVVIYQFEPEWTGRIVAESLAPEKTSLLGRVIHDPCFGTNWVEPYTNGRVRKIEDIHASGLADCHIELLEKAEIYANLIVPIVYHEQLWGLLCAHQCSQPRYWETLEVELLEKLATQVAIAIHQSQLYQQAQQELLERQRMEEALRNIALGVSTQMGEVFFHSLVQYLSKALAVDYAIVARLVNNKTDYMETVAVWANGQIVENFECSFLHNPYYNTLHNSNQRVCIYPSQVQREFPLDSHLRDMQAEGYMGMPIYDSTGQSIGILAVFSRHPLHDVEFMSEILKIFSMQVGSELQRTQAEVALKKLNEELEIRIAERTAQLEQINNDLLLEIQERQRIEQIIQKQFTALEESQNFLRQVIDTNPNLIFVKDLQGRFVLANQALAGIYGTTVAELIGKTNPDFNPNADDVAYFNSVTEEVITMLEPYIIPEIKVITVTGETRYFQSIKSPLIATDGKAYQILGVLTDITERKRAEQEISNALEREKELGELKSRFVSMTSHEFRTPLTVIASSAGILKDFGHKLDDTQKKKHLDCIQTYVKHTTQLLDDILLINKAETGNLAFEPAPLDLIPFCQKLTEEIQLSAPNHTIVFSSHSQGSASGNFDKKLLRQILINLLSNAIKYSPHNAIVKFELNIAVQNVIFSVQDQGIGIPEADQVKLFESFHRARNVGNIPGTGLGLSIVAKCIDLHKGSIAVNSQVGMGTTFTVTIPLQSATFTQ